MNSTELLLTIAELSLTLAGFSGVVVGIRGTRAGSLSRQDRLGLMNILASSGGAMMFSLLPFALAATGLREAAAWATTSLLAGFSQFVTFLLLAWLPDE